METNLISKKIQTNIKKLIAEEYIAAQIYMDAILSVKKDDVKYASNIFYKLQKDELDDHMIALIEWCREYNIDIPCITKDCEKLAGIDLVKIFKHLKSNQSISYYLNEAIKAEEVAIKSYKQVIDSGIITEFTDLQSLIWHIYYDEIEHLEILNTAKIACDASIDLII